MNKTQKITCLGCNKKYPTKVYDDGSYTPFYQNIRTKEHFCSECIEERPIIAIKDRVIFRDNKYFYKGKQVCSQCTHWTKPEDKLVQAFNKLWYCQDCWDWQMEASNSGVATCVRYTHDKELNCRNYELKTDCGKCEFCQERKQIPQISTTALIKELMARADFNVLTTWRDDSFITRLQELMWELKQVRGLTPEQIEKEVNTDIFEKKESQRKFSRGT